jgi:hypothetical protein
MWRAVNVAWCAVKRGWCAVKRGWCAVKRGWRRVDVWWCDVKRQWCHVKVTWRRVNVWWCHVKRRWRRVNVLWRRVNVLWRRRDRYRHIDGRRRGAKARVRRLGFGGCGAARELRDRWLERLNQMPMLPQGKYDVTRALPVAARTKALPQAA